MTINKTADKIARLSNDLNNRGFVNEAIEIAILASQFTDALDKFLPITKNAMAKLFFERETTLYGVRERLMSSFYQEHFKPYEALLRS